jgi:transposase-like protein
MTKAEQTRLTAWRLRVLRQAADEGNVARICRRFGISRKSFYKWKRRHPDSGAGSNSPFDNVATAGTPS